MSFGFKVFYAHTTTFAFYKRCHFVIGFLVIMQKKVFNYNILTQVKETSQNVHWNMENNPSMVSNI